MRYRGIEFDIKIGIRKSEWIWAIHTTTPRHGRMTGSRALAVVAAQRAIDEWCNRHPTDCEPEASAA